MTQHSHPLEDVFGITAGSTFKEDSIADTPNERETNLVDPTSGEVITRKVSDVTSSDIDREERLEDLHIDGQLEAIHDAALVAFEQQSRMSQEVDPKFSARNAEVAAQYLNIALGAVNSRVDSKFKRNKIRIAREISGAPTTVNQNVIVADRNDVLRALLGKTEKIIDGGDQ